MKVNCIILGAPKCGTTSLFHALAQHPEITDCKVKEPDFFLKASTKKEEEQYHKLFGEANKIWLEASTKYSVDIYYSGKIAQRIYTYNPNLKFIYVVRKPIERIVSQYIHWYERGYTQLPFEQAWKKNSFIRESGRYFTQLSQFMQFYKEKSVFLIDFHSLLYDFHSKLKAICDFLEITQQKQQEIYLPHKNRSYTGQFTPQKLDYIKDNLRWTKKIIPKAILAKGWQVSTAASKKSIKKPPLVSPELQREILGFYKEEIIQLNNLIRDDISHWLELP